ncbi:hypothetical protein BDZ97DRAFT_836797 [Flammula alnicola]|nr:hypothetical protein BDZ97DRAFT_836797 [Flammula alnicola]
MSMIEASMFVYAAGGSIHITNSRYYSTLTSIREAQPLQEPSAENLSQPESSAAHLMLPKELNLFPTITPQLQEVTISRDQSPTHTKKNGNPVARNTSSFLSFAYSHIVQNLGGHLQTKSMGPYVFSYMIIVLFGSKSFIPLWTTSPSESDEIETWRWNVYVGVVGMLQITKTAGAPDTNHHMTSNLSRQCPRSSQRHTIPT